MIGWLHGQIIAKEQPNKLIINANGIGFEVEILSPIFLKLEQNSSTISLHTHTIIRPDAFLLFGFLEKLELSLFRTLLKVNGVGPKMALGILANIEPDQLITCIRQQDLARLTKLPGIGQKTAERLLIEMKSKIKQLLPANYHYDTPNENLVVNEAIAALEALGYKQHDAEKIIYKINDRSKTCEQLIRQALQLLAGSPV